MTSFASFTATLSAATVALLLSGCSAPAPQAAPMQQGIAPSPAALAAIDRVETTQDGTSTADTVDAYKRDIALRITHVNSTKIYPGQPQALLRSVVVIKFAIDSSGRLLRSEIQRSNRDKVTEASALSALRATAPFPKPAGSLLRNGRLEISETWLFNTDGRFQIRTLALPQMDR